MNTALALEIYRGIWVVESSRVDALKSVLRDARSPGAIYDPSEKLNTFSLIKATSGLTVPSSSSNDSKKAKKIAVTNVNGVITKAGGMSSAGMEELSADMIVADNDPDVVGHLVKVDSPGGSATGMIYMQKTMQSLKKPKVTLVTRQGMAASGGWGILSEGDWVMAESDDAEVGCHGVMWSVSGVPNGQKDANGEVNFVVVSSTSPNKNEAPLIAINNNDTSLMQDEVNKLHLVFQASSRAARPNIKEEQMTGAMYPASEVVGSMIDAIGSEQEAINKILELSNPNSTFNKNLNNQSTHIMTAAEYKAQHPNAHAEIMAAGRQEGIEAGIAQEKDRVDTWMVYRDIDPVAVQKGIESGKAVSNKEMAAFNLKAAQTATTTSALEALQGDSADPLTPPEATVEKPKTAKEIADEKEFAASFPKLVAKGITLKEFNAKRINAN